MTSHHTSPFSYLIIIIIIIITTTIFTIGVRARGEVEGLQPLSRANQFTRAIAEFFAQQTATKNE